MNPFVERLKRQYPDDRTDELKAAAAKVQQTMDSEGWRLIWQFIDRAHQDALTRLFAGHSGQNGRVLEQAEYARLCGYLAGIREPQTAATAYLELLEAREQHNP